MLFFLLIFYQNQGKNQPLQRNQPSPETIEKNQNEIKTLIEPYQTGKAIGAVQVYTQDLEQTYGRYFPDTVEAKTNPDYWQQVIRLTDREARIQAKGVELGLFPAAESGRISEEKIAQTKVYILKNFPKDYWVDELLFE